MNQSSTFEVLDASLFTQFDHSARQRHTLASVAFDAAAAKLHYAEDEEATTVARGKWLDALIELTESTLDYVQSLREGVAQTTGQSLDDFLQDRLTKDDDDLGLD